MSSGVSTCCFAWGEAFAAHGEMASCLLSRHSCCPGRASGRTGVKDRAEPGRVSGAGGVLDAGSREPIIGAAGEGPRTCWGLCGCRRPMAGHPAGQAAGCIHPFVCPRRAAGGHGAGSRQGPGGANQMGARAAGTGGGQNVRRPRARWRGAE